MGKRSAILLEGQEFNYKSQQQQTVLKNVTGSSSIHTLSICVA
jgi:hypothetical protein